MLSDVGGVVPEAVEVVAGVSEVTETSESGVRKTRRGKVVKESGWKNRGLKNRQHFIHFRSLRF